MILEVYKMMAAGIFCPNIGSCLLEPNVFTIGVGKKFPKGGDEHSHEECTRSPLRAVPSVTRVVLARRPQKQALPSRQCRRCRLLTCILPTLAHATEMSR
jgi:hypothetical protein